MDLLGAVLIVQLNVSSDVVELLNLCVSAAQLAATIWFPRCPRRRRNLTSPRDAEPALNETSAPAASIEALIALRLAAKRLDRSAEPLGLVNPLAALGLKLGCAGAKTSCKADWRPVRGRGPPIVARLRRAGGPCRAPRRAEPSSEEVLMFDSAVLLVADADDALRSFLTEQLIADAAGVFQGCDRAQTSARASVHRPDVLVLGDLGVTGASVDLIRAIRASTGLPTEPSADLRVLALVDTDDELAVLRAFHAGADDVADRGIGYAVLRARLLVLLGRAGSRTGESTVKVGRLEVSSARRRAWLHGEPLELSGKEFALLSMLASDPSRVFTREELLHDVWGFYPGTRTRTLDSHASRLRRKLRACGDEFLVNVWGVGYALVADVPAIGERAA